MTPHEFKVKWSRPSGNERQTYQSHFNDLCEMLGVAKPSAADAADLTYTFEKQVDKASGGTGAAYVWKRGQFGWEYKAKESDLPGAYVQLLGYMNALENPPLLIVSDTKLSRIYPTFPNQKTVPIDIPIGRIDEPENLAILRRVFSDSMSFRDADGPEHVTRVAAEKFGAIAAALGQRGEEPHAVAHFLVQLLFCLFAEDIGILPRGLFGKVLAFGAKTPAQFTGAVDELMRAMASGGFFWGEEIPHVNGGLFREFNVISLEREELATLAEAARLNWAKVEPAIFGTLFERSLDPNSRAKLGAHYTGRADILRVVEPVVMTPLRRRWVEVRAEAEPLRAKWQATPRGRTSDTAWTNARQAFERKLRDFRDELKAVLILDPACGSGNFLYIALENLLDLENEVIGYGVESGLSGSWPDVHTGQLLGLEINEYAREIAQVVIWIGYLQWMIGHGHGFREPVLDELETIRLQDSLLDRSNPDHVKEAEWPQADYIIGNPPFLGDKKMVRELGAENASQIREVFDGRVPGGADLCCYFFEKAREHILTGTSKRAGLLATNSIRGGANRFVLDRIKQTGDIFLAWSDERWILDGAAVRISIVGFDDGTESSRHLDGFEVASINSALRSITDISGAAVLAENTGLSFIGDQKSGAFDVPAELAGMWLSMPANPNGRLNTDVVRPWINGLDITRRPRNMWIIDFGLDMPLIEAALYEAPFEYVRTTVKPDRDKSKTGAKLWWLHERPRGEMRAALVGKRRYIGTARVAKHRLFMWFTPNILADSQVVVFAREDDYFFGVLHSRAHEVWSLRMGTWLGVGNDPRYTPTTCFETFPLPWPPGQEPVDDPRVIEIAAAAKDLDAKRTAWLNPPDCPEAELKKRTLTNLYNARPSWLAMAHERLDRAVWSAYGWEEEPTETTEDDLLTRLLALNGERARP